jgi:hypothetical protein
MVIYVELRLYVTGDLVNVTSERNRVQMYVFLQLVVYMYVDSVAVM